MHCNVVSCVICISNEVCISRRKRVRDILPRLDSSSDLGIEFRSYCCDCKIDLDKYVNDNKFIKERRFEVILTSFSSSNDCRPLLV